MQPTLGDARSILDKQEAYVEELMAKDGVTAVGVALRTCFVVGVSDESVKLDLPQTVEGLPVVKEVTRITTCGPVVEEEESLEEGFWMSKILWIGLSVLTVVILLVVLKTAP